MIEPKQKPAGKPVHTAEKARLPRTAMRAVWLRTREGTRRFAAEEKQEGQYREAASLEEHAVDTAVSAAESAAEATLRGGKKFAQYIAQNQRKAHSDAIVVHEQASSAAAGKSRSPQAGQTPYYKGRNGYAERTRQPPGRNAVHTKTDIQDVHQSRLRHDSVYRFKVTTRRKPQPRQAPNPKTATVTTRKNADANKVRQTAAKAARRAKQAAQAAQEATKKVADIVMAWLKALWAATQTLVAAIAAGGTAAVVIIIIICMIALVVGSAFGIFFAEESIGTGITIQEAVAQLNREYQDRLEEIENSVTHDRQEIVSNDGSYAIAWQDVLAVFAARTSGAVDGAPVAFIDEDKLNRLRDILWDMNAVDHRIDTNTSEVEMPDEDGNTTTTTVTETVITIELIHKTAEEMRTVYAFNARQNEYLTLLSGENTAELWGQLLGGFTSAGGGIMTPAGGWQPTGSLQWPLTITGTITSQFGYRTDPITDETSYHSGTDIAVPEGTPILAAADGTVSIANALDSWGGSYGYYVKLDHGNGLETLYAHCSSICVTAGQQVKAGQVIGYVGHTGRATGDHLHFEVYQNGQRTDALTYFTS